MTASTALPTDQPNMRPGSSVEHQVLSTLQSLNLSPDTWSRSDSPNLANGGMMAAHPTHMAASTSSYPEFAFQDVRQELQSIQAKFDRWLQTKKESILAENRAYKDTLRANSGIRKIYF